MNKKKIVFLTGTRADFGKLKTLIKKIDNSDDFECHVFVTGMHMLSKYGSTYNEVENENFSNVYKIINQGESTKMELVLANTITAFSNYVEELKPDLIVVHGDRVEALAGAIVSAINNILLAHIEGGELSGTIDESIRHAISKFAHLHFVANEECKQRLMQMGEISDAIYVIGSPDIDVMMSKSLPDIKTVKDRYRICFDKYAIFIYHPVTTELDKIKENIKNSISSILKSDKNYIIIYPNNDEGNKVIIKEIEKLRDNKKIRILPSMRFEYFLTLLKNASFIIGNSSAGVRESEIYGIKTINIGNRQKNRNNNKEIINVPDNEKEILAAIEKIDSIRPIRPKNNFGNGNSANKFYKILKNKEIFGLERQKYFKDNYISHPS